MTRAEIAAVIPHAGAMCLLDEVLSWDAGGIRCLSRTYRDPANPMRVAGTLRAICGAEYAAQAMAVHGGLTGGVASRPRAGYIASLRDVECAARLLDEFDGDLLVDADRLMGEASHVIYGFEVRVGGTRVLAGRAAVVLDSDAADG
jgi:predicted hotdog family 3-hydroxylacyl-ACP dehydratase